MKPAWPRSYTVHPFAARNIQSKQSNTLYLMTVAAQCRLRIWSMANRHTIFPIKCPNNRYWNISQSAPISILSAEILLSCQWHRCPRRMSRQCVAGDNHGQWHGSSPAPVSLPSADPMNRFCNKKTVDYIAALNWIFSQKNQQIIRKLTSDREYLPRCVSANTSACAPTDVGRFSARTTRQRMLSVLPRVALSAAGRE